MVGRAHSMTDRQTMAYRFRQVRLGGLHGIVDGFTACKMGCNGGCKGASCAVRVRCINKLAFEDVEEPAVVQEVGGPFRKKVPALDQDVFAAESGDHFSRAPRVGERLDLDS